MSGYPLEEELYPFADELCDYLDDALAKARRIRELALMKRGPLTEAEKTEARALARDVCSLIGDAAEAARNVKDGTNW